MDDQANAPMSIYIVSIQKKRPNPTLGPLTRNTPL